MMCLRLCNNFILCPLIKMRGHSMSLGPIYETGGCFTPRLVIHNPWPEKLVWVKYVCLSWGRFIVGGMNHSTH